MNQVVAPYGPLVMTGRLDGSNGQALSLERRDGFMVGFEQRVVDAARHPEQVQVSLLRCDCRNPGKRGRVQASGEGADPGEEVRVVEAGQEALSASHGEAGDGAVVSVFEDGILGLDPRDDLGEEHGLEEVDVLCVEGRGAAGLQNGEVAVAKSHDDDHGLGLAGGNQAVEDIVGLASGEPAVCAVGVAVKQIEDGIAGFGLGIEAGRRVDVVFVLIDGSVEDNAGGVEVVSDLAVGYGLHLPGHGRIAGDGEGIDEFLKIGLDGGVPGVENVAAVDAEAIGVNLRRVRLSGEAPKTGGVLRHGHVGTLNADEDLFGVGSGNAKGDGTVGADFGRDQWRS